MKFVSMYEYDSYFEREKTPKPKLLVDTSNFTESIAVATDQNDKLVIELGESLKKPKMTGQNDKTTSTTKLACQAHPKLALNDRARTEQSIEETVDAIATDKLGITSLIMTDLS